MAIAYRSGNVTAGSTSTSVVLTKPASTADEDIMIVNLYREIASVWTAPAGWTQIYDTPDGDGGPIRATCYWKRASSEGADYTFTVASTWCSGTISSFSGCIETGSPINASATGTCSGGVAAHTVTATTITTTLDNTMRVVLTIDNYGTEVTAGTSGMTKSSSSNVQGNDTFYLTQAASGSSGSKTFSAVSDYEHWVSFHIALTPEPEAVETPVVWGRETSVSEPNVRTFAVNWTGTGSISGTGDTEKITLSGAQYMESEVANTGTNVIVVSYNKYNAGDTVSVKYRTGTTIANCTSAGWTAYTVPFTSTGYSQVRIEYL